MATEHTSARSADTPTDISDRVNNRSHRPQSQRFAEFMTSGWAPRADLGITPRAVSAFTAARREAVSHRFPGERLVIPAGSLKVRSNDTDYRFRPHSGFAHLTGFGTDEEPDAVLVLDPTFDDQGTPAGTRHSCLSGHWQAETHKSSTPILGTANFGWERAPRWTMSPLQAGYGQYTSTRFQTC